MHSLAELRRRGIKSTANLGLERILGSQNSGDAFNFACFPWAVVETSQASLDADAKEFCYCQAANAACVALKMREETIKANFAWQRGTIPPFIAFTCVGSEFRVWLAYQSAVIGESRCRVSTSHL